jgi:hypothetical protein
MLNDVGFVWELSYEWLSQYEGLLQYVNVSKHGNAMVPNIYKDNPSLGISVNNQRQEFKSNNLSKDRIELLNKLKFV